MDLFIFNFVALQPPHAVNYLITLLFFRIQFCFINRNLLMMNTLCYARAGRTETVEPNIFYIMQNLLIERTHWGLASSAQLQLNW